jgi:hypothetical protein
MKSERAAAPLFRKGETLNELDLQFVNIRHSQQHTGEL